MLQRQTYSKTIDVWALGVIVFVLLCGCLPFDDDAGRVSAESVRLYFVSHLCIPPPHTHTNTHTTQHNKNSPAHTYIYIPTPIPKTNHNRCTSASSCASPRGPATSPRARRTSSATSSVRCPCPLLFPQRWLVDQAACLSYFASLGWVWVGMSGLRLPPDHHAHACSPNPQPNLLPSPQTPHTDINPRTRYTAEQALNHPWVQGRGNVVKANNYLQVRFHIHIFHLTFICPDRNTRPVRYKACPPLSLSPPHHQQTKKQSPRGIRRIREAAHVLSLSRNSNSGFNLAALASSASAAALAGGGGGAATSPPDYTGKLFLEDRWMMVKGRREASCLMK